MMPGLQWCGKEFSRTQSWLSSIAPNILRAPEEAEQASMDCNCEIKLKVSQGQGRKHEG